VDDSYDARRLEENRRKVEDKMSRQGLVPKVY
jgi:serine protease Do